LGRAKKYVVDEHDLKKRLLPNIVSE
jgi:hypothetical protein